MVTGSDVEGIARSARTAADLFVADVGIHYGDEELVQSFERSIDSETLTAIEQISLADGQGVLAVRVLEFLQSLQGSEKYQPEIDDGDEDDDSTDAAGMALDSVAAVANRAEADAVDPLPIRPTCAADTLALAGAGFGLGITGLAMIIYVAREKVEKTKTTTRRNDDEIIETVIEEVKKTSISATQIKAVAEAVRSLLPKLPPLWESCPTSIVEDR